MTLRAHMQQVLAGWPEGAPQGWRVALEDTVLNFGSRSLGTAHDGVARPAYPPLRAGNDGRYLFRAFHGINPDQVRVVVIGQDPYPERARATGRAFEDGASLALGIAESMKRLLQSALTAMDPGLHADQNGAGWNLIREQVEARLHDQAMMEHYFDGLTDQGVLFLNAAWTFTEIEWHPDAGERRRRRDRVQNAHRALWRPVMERVIDRLASRAGPPVFLLFGREAQKCFNSATRNLQEVPASICCDHPTARRGTYFDTENPLRQVNQALRPPNQALEACRDIQWWPQVVP